MMCGEQVPILSSVRQLPPFHLLHISPQMSSCVKRKIKKTPFSVQRHLGTSQMNPFISEKHSVYSPHLPLALSFKWNRFTQQIYTAVRNHHHNVVPRFSIAAVEQLLMLLLKLLGADLTATACSSASSMYHVP